MRFPLERGLGASPAVLRGDLLNGNFFLKIKKNKSAGLFCVD